MNTKIFLILMAFSLMSCTQVKVDDAEIDNGLAGKLPPRTQTKTLDNVTRNALNAWSPGALIAVFTEDGVILYGAPGEKFKVDPVYGNAKTADQSKTLGKPVNNIAIKTYVNSPKCQLFSNGLGGGVWYPSSCPH